MPQHDKEFLMKRKLDTQRQARRFFSSRSKNKDCNATPNSEAALKTHKFGGRCVLFHSLLQQTRRTVG